MPQPVCTRLCYAADVCAWAPSSLSIPATLMLAQKGLLIRRLQARDREPSNIYRA